MEFCQLQDCPIGSTCRNLDDGFECIANTTFDGRASALAYNLTRPIVLNDNIPEVTPFPIPGDSISIVYRY